MENFDVIIVGAGKQFRASNPLVLNAAQAYPVSWRLRDTYNAIQSAT
jgi:hypothetical protein